jgi:hypothetical protein
MQFDEFKKIWSGWIDSAMNPAIPHAPMTKAVTVLCVVRWHGNQALLN